MLRSKISSALADSSTSQWTDVKVLAAEIRAYSPKLGALQRWCDVASTADRSEGDKELLSVLDAIMQTTEEVVEDVVNRTLNGSLRVFSRPLLTIRFFGMV